MSSTQSAVVISPSNPDAPDARPQPSSQTDLQIESAAAVGQDDGAVLSSAQKPSSPVSQRVFEQSPLTAVKPSHPVLISVFVILSNLIQMTANFAGVAGGAKLGEALGAKSSYASWIAASYGLTQGTFVLIAGCLGDVWGYKRLLLGGGCWLTICCLICGFCTSFYPFVIMRALAGIGGACIMPNAVALISNTNPPGKTRNFLLGLFGASSPLGGYLGALFLGTFFKGATWNWFFWFITILNVMVFVPVWIVTPTLPPADPRRKIDWIGAALGTGALILFNFVWNQAPSVGWSTPYEIALLLVSVLLFGAFILWERNIASQPIIPLDIFKAPSFLTLIGVVLLNYMSVGIVIWYQILWMQEVWFWSVLHTAVAWTPFVVCAIGASVLAAWMIPRLAAQWILAFGTLTILISGILMATVPIHQIYWAQVFPSIVLFSFCPDFVYTAGQIIACSAVRRHQQGIAASLISTLNLYGNSLGLGFASTVEDQVAEKHHNTILGYRAALLFAVGIAGVALVLDVFFVRMAKNEKEGWEEEDVMMMGELPASAVTTGAAHRSGA